LQKNKKSLEYRHMARVCSICGKKFQVVWKLRKLRGRYNPTAKRRKYPNLQWVKLASGTRVKQEGKMKTISSPKRVKACAKCIKTLAKKK
jgi:ribosomal protein L28